LRVYLAALELQVVDALRELVPWTAGRETPT
jgi:hypothetical protein